MDIRKNTSGDKFQNFLKGCVCSTAVMVAGVLVSDAAFAQTKIEQMIVTAQKRAQDIQSVPASISAFSGEGLESRQIKNIQDLSSATPNVTLGNTFGGTIPQLSIRGVSPDGTNPAMDQTVALHIDGVYQPRALGLGLIMTDIDSVEILRGPQGTLYGRNANAGVINLITNKPTDTFEGSATIFGGSFARYGARGYVSGPVVNNISARLTAIIDRSDGYGDNLLNGHDVNGNKSYGGRLAVRLKPHDDVTIDLSATRTFEHTNTPTYLVSPGAPVSGPNVNALLAKGFVLTATNAPWKNYGLFDPEQTVETKAATGIIAWDISPSLSVKSITGWQRTSWKNFQDYSAMTLPLFTSGFDASSHTFSQEFNLNAKFWDRLDTVVGLYYLNDTVDNAGTDLGLPIGLAYLPGSPAAGTHSLSQLGNVKAISRAAFLDVTLSITDQLRLVGGIRKTYDSKSVIQHIGSILANGAFSAGVGCGGEQYHPVPRLDYHSTTGKIGVQYDFTPEIMGYVQWQNGFKTGGYNNGACYDRTNPSTNAFNPETIYSWEAGIKSSLFNDSMTLNVSVFDYRYSNMQMQRVILGVGTAPATTQLDNAASATIKGAEIEANAYLTDEFKVDLDVGLLDAKYGSPLFSVNGATGTNVNTNIGGFQIPRAPKVTLNVGLEYTMCIGDLGELKSRGEYSYSSRIWYSIFDEQLAHQDGYSLFNAIFTFTPDNSPLTFQVYARNILDKAWVSGAYPSGTLVNARGNWGPPRTLGAEVTAKF